MRHNRRHPARRSERSHEMANSRTNLLSVIIVYNDLQKFEEAKLWLDQQTLGDHIQLIALDNRKKRFSSVAKALNYGAEISEGDFLVFMHQDMYLWDLTALDTYRTYLMNHPNTIIGVAGRAEHKIVTDIYESKEKLQRSTRANGQLYEVDALDECLIAMTRQTWERLRFDEVCCDNWHGYALDICIANKLSGYQNVMVPLKVCHESLGNPEANSFRRTIGRLVRKYRKTGLPRLSGTCIYLKCSLRSYYRYRIKGYINDISKALGLR